MINSSLFPQTDVALCFLVEALYYMVLEPAFLKGENYIRIRLAWTSGPHAYFNDIVMHTLITATSITMHIGIFLIEKALLSK